MAARGNTAVKRGAVLSIMLAGHKQLAELPMPDESRNLLQNWFALLAFAQGRQDILARVLAVEPDFMPHIDWATAMIQTDMANDPESFFRVVAPDLIPEEATTEESTNGQPS